ncbi:MAG TPA: hypothetical protein VFO10_21690, partial [Oligoflexus sp.]|uniref:hypothetical protein n=1 Tax=Oligoflexus sp. TaxID=1971216 RepID=UPI002D7E982A
LSQFKMQSKTLGSTTKYVELFKDVALLRKPHDPSSGLKGQYVPSEVPMPRLDLEEMRDTIEVPRVAVNA